MTMDPRDIGALRFAHQAMATEFEIFCAHDGREYAQQACWAAFDLLDRMEHELSRFIENSDISRINGLAAGESARVNRWTMECLLLARQACAETAGAFDISLGTGLQSLQLAPRESTVRATANGVRLDLGGIGKGYAVDRMAEVLAEWDIGRALIHGGGSSVRALDAPEGLDGWPLTMGPCGAVAARHRVFSASGIRKGGHILDPRTGQPVRGREAAWVSAPVDGHPSPSAVAEAYSTAFMILPEEQVEAICLRHPGVKAWLQFSESTEKQLEPQMNTDEHRSEKNSFIRVHPCSSVANSVLAFSAESPNKRGT
jgi:thiamine biosynthesis lipoprotein